MFVRIRYKDDGGTYVYTVWTVSKC